MKPSNESNPSSQLRTLVVVSCGEAKREYRTTAADLYVSTLFQYAKRYAQLYGDDWCIASAKHGWLSPNAWVSPYDETVVGASLSQLNLFVNKFDCGILDYLQLHRAQLLSPAQYDADGRCVKYETIENLRVIALVGKAYKPALKRFKHSVEYPLDGLGIGKRIGWLKRQVEAAEQLQSA